MDALQKLTDTFFNEYFWLPPNVTWKDFQNNPKDNVYIPQPKDLWIIFPVSGLLFLVRLIFERYLAKPIGLRNGISNKTVSAAKNETLEKVYRKNKYPSDVIVQGLSKQMDWSEKMIQRWFRKRRNQDRPSQMTKFTETAWRCFFYLIIFIYGLYTVTQKSWFYNVSECWMGLPRQNVGSEVYWYYIIELGFYLSLLFSQFADVQRKDFWEQFIHHIVTILLMWFSWCVNYVRIGSLILCLHDAVDYLLEGAKLARYVNYRTLCDVMFGIFTVTWLVTRLILFPYFILWTTWFDSFIVGGHAKSLYLFNLLLWILQILHIFWFYLILKVAVNALTSGKVEKDVRSASEDSVDEGTNTSSNNHRCVANGKADTVH